MPVWTDTYFRSNSGEDHLGSLSVGVNIAENLLPGINTVTPRARYRSFYCWVLLDFLENSSDKSRNAFKFHLRRREMAYILANLISLSQGNYSHGIIGSIKGRDILKTGQDILDVNQSYVQNDYGGYAIYRGSMLTMHLIQDTSNPGNSDAIMPKGRELAEAFRSGIEKTCYYQKYLDKDLIQKAVLNEYGVAAGLNEAIGHPDGNILLDVFLRPDLLEKSKEVKRRETLAYFLEMISAKPENSWNTNEAWRKILLESRFMDNSQYNCSPEFIYAQKGWRIYQIRQYYAYALETIFCHMIEKLHLRSSGLDELLNPMLESQWVDASGLNYKYDPESSLKQLIDDLPALNLEEGINVTRKIRVHEIDLIAHVVYPLFILVEIYRQVKMLQEDTYCKQFTLVGGEDHLSLDKFVHDMESMLERNAKVKDLCFMIITQYIIHQHHRVALEKLLGYDLETFRILDNEGKLEYRSGYSPNFNQFRGHQALTVLNDLGLLHRADTLYLVTQSGRKMIVDVKEMARRIKVRKWGETVDEEN